MKTSITVITLFFFASFVFSQQQEIQINTGNTYLISNKIQGRSQQDLSDGHGILKLKSDFGVSLFFKQYSNKWKGLSVVAGLDKRWFTHSINYKHRYTNQINGDQINTLREVNISNEKINFHIGLDKQFYFFKNKLSLGLGVHLKSSYFFEKNNSVSNQKNYHALKVNDQTYLTNEIYKPGDIPYELDLNHRHEHGEFKLILNPTISYKLKENLKINLSTFLFENESVDFDSESETSRNVAQIDENTLGISTGGLGFHNELRSRYIFYSIGLTFTIR